VSSSLLSLDSKTLANPITQSEQSIRKKAFSQITTNPTLPYPDYVSAISAVKVLDKDTYYPDFALCCLKPLNKQILHATMNHQFGFRSSKESRKAGRGLAFIMQN
jgi:hypothetical protein